MIYRGDDYFTQTAAPSPLQHTWSLGIEEQFYVLWPLIVVAVLWAVRAAPAGCCSALCVAGAAASVLACAVLYDPFDVNRAYFGTDARAQALLIGCALAALLHRPGRAEAARRRAGPPGDRPWRARLLPAAAGWGSWWSAAAVDAHGRRGPVPVPGWLRPRRARRGRRAGRLRAAAPGAAGPRAGRRPAGVAGEDLLRGVPVALAAVRADQPRAHRPGRHALLVARFAATLAAATASYVLLERPVRTGRWPFPMPRLTGPAAGATATAAIGVTAIVVLAATAVPGVPTVASLRSAPLVVETPQPNAVQNPPMLRPGRRPGELPRIAFYGDSVSWSLGFYLPSYADQLDVAVDSLEGCGIARLPEIRVKNMPQTNYDWCLDWPATWQARLNNTDPDVAVLLLSRWELMDRKLYGRFQHVGEPAFDRYLREELDRALEVLLSRGAHVVILTSPYNRRYERPNGGLYDEDLPERVDAWNKLLHEAAAKHDDADHRHRPQPAGLPGRRVHLHRSTGSGSAATACTSAPTGSASGSHRG